MHEISTSGQWSFVPSDSQVSFPSNSVRPESFELLSQCHCRLNEREQTDTEPDAQCASNGRRERGERLVLELLSDFRVMHWDPGEFGQDLCAVGWPHPGLVLPTDLVVHLATVLQALRVAFVQCRFHSQIVTSAIHTSLQVSATQNFHGFHGRLFVNDVVLTWNIFNRNKENLTDRHNFDSHTREVWAAGRGWTWAGAVGCSCICGWRIGCHIGGNSGFSGRCACTGQSSDPCCQVPCCKPYPNLSKFHIFERDRPVKK